MSETPDEEPLLVATDSVSIARLHGLACWNCGAVTRLLAACGVTRDEAGRVRPKRLCAVCRPVSAGGPQHAAEAFG